jgi:hypothetical protein
VLAGEDEECMEVMAREFQNPRSGWITHIYWEDLDSQEKIWKGSKNQDAEPSCTLM